MDDNQNQQNPAVPAADPAVDPNAQPAGAPAGNPAPTWTPTPVADQGQAPLTPPPAPAGAPEPVAPEPQAPAAEEGNGDNNSGGMGGNTGAGTPPVGGAPAM